MAKCWAREQILSWNRRWPWCVDASTQEWCASKVQRRPIQFRTDSVRRQDERQTKGESDLNVTFGGKKKRKNDSRTRLWWLSKPLQRALPHTRTHTHTVAVPYIYLFKCSVRGNAVGNGKLHESISSVLWLLCVSWMSGVRIVLGWYLLRNDRNFTIYRLLLRARRWFGANQWVPDSQKGRYFCESNYSVLLIISKNLNQPGLSHLCRINK